MLEIASGFGFLPHVWLEVAQLVCNVKGIPQCTGCGRRYVRDNKPQSGRGNYCKQCGKKVAKRDYAERKRALERQAQQLFKDGIPIEDIVQQLKRNARKMQINDEWVQKRVLPKDSGAHSVHR